MKKPTFDIESALKALREDQRLTDKDGNLTLSQLTTHFRNRLEKHINL